MLIAKFENAKPFKDFKSLQKINSSLHDRRAIRYELKVAGGQIAVVAHIAESGKTIYAHFCAFRINGFKKEHVAKLIDGGSMRAAEVINKAIENTGFNFYGNINSQIEIEEAFTAIAKSLGYNLSNSQFTIKQLSDY